MTYAEKKAAQDARRAQTVKRNQQRGELNRAKVSAKDAARKERANQLVTPSKAKQEQAKKKDAVDNKRRGAELERASRHNTVKAEKKPAAPASPKPKLAPKKLDKQLAPKKKDKQPAPKKLDKQPAPKKKEDTSTPGRYGKGDSKTVLDNKGQKKANVSEAQLKASGLSLRQYLNEWNRTGKRPSEK